MKRFLLIIPTVSLLFGCDSYLDRSETSQIATSTEVDHAEEVDPFSGWGNWGINLNTIDAGTRPGDDFFHYVNGRWLEGYEIPADQATYGTFLALREKAEQDVHVILEDLVTDQLDGGALGELTGDLYESWQNTDRIETLGLSAVEPFLSAIENISDHSGVMTAFSELYHAAPFSIFIIPDPADTSQYSVFLSQGGLGMPNRDYYLSDEARFSDLRDQYRSYIAEQLRAAGFDNAKNRADAIFGFEERIATVHWSAAESRDISRVYNPMDQAALTALAPEIDWDQIIQSRGIGDIETFVVAQTTAIEESAKIVATTNVDTLKDYLAFHFIHDNVAFMPESFRGARFAFSSRALQGIQEPPERWRSGVRFINSTIGEAVGQVYLRRHFPPENKATMAEMITYLRAALRERLNENEWMDEETLGRALLKLDSFEPRIGYPDQWTNFDELRISRADALGNRIRVNAFLWNERVERAKQPVDRSQWPYPPQTVNASYDPLLNQLTFPAGILQPPFFNAAADPAVNFGGIGATIGHEMGHGFDDQGSRFDHEGRIRNWWSDESQLGFRARSDVLVEQYNEIEPIEGMTINGELTLGENIGDLGGLQMAYTAWRRYVADNYDGDAPVLDGFSGDQRFFLAYAQVWRGKRREDSLRQQLLTDPHSPYDARTNGVVRNMDAWYQAFDVQPDDALYLPPEQRVRIW